MDLAEDTSTPSRTAEFVPERYGTFSAKTRAFIKKDYAGANTK
jgi:hypothetical protein